MCAKVTLIILQLCPMKVRIIVKILSEGDVIRKVLCGNILKKGIPIQYNAQFA